MKFGFTGSISVTDTIAPILSSANLIDMTLECSDDNSPNSVGRPTVTDNLDPDPDLSYMEIALQSACGFRRVWTATDHAGNSASVSQRIDIRSVDSSTISISSPTEVQVPCGSIESTISSANYMLSVSHPCGRPVTTTYMDSAVIDRCDFSFNRTWTIQDDCGSTRLFRQTVRILDQRLPNSPTDREINVHVGASLQWPQYPGDILYRVYVWPRDDPRPEQPTTSTTSLRYTPGLNPGTWYNWQIEYVNRANNSIVNMSPVWSFETRPYPDLTVNTINLPATAFSGQSFEVSWIVINIGNITTPQRIWSDAVYFGPSCTNDRLRRRGAVVRHNSFVDPDDDGYIASATINLGNQDLGNFFVCVETDIYRQVL